MEDRRVLVDTSIFIEYFRKENKSKTKLYQLRKNGYTLLTSAICYFEYMSGSKNSEFDVLLFTYIEIIAFEKNQAETASNIFKNLKKKNALIEFRDILIASSAISENISLATLNKKHFERIDSLNLLVI
jgi:predicted nucleic acid-binding protein